MTINRQQNRLLFIFGVITTVVLIVAALLRLFTPQPPPPISLPTISQKNLDGSASNFGNITFSAESPDFPEDLGVYLVQSTTLSTQELETVFSLNSDPEIPNYWENDQFSLERDPEKNRYLLVNKLVDAESISEVIEPSQVTDLAKEFLATYFSSFSVSPLETQLIFYTTEGGHYTPTVVTQANLVEIPFAPIVETIPVYFTNDRSYPFVVTATSDKVIKLNFTPNQLTFELVTRYPLISLESALVQINERNQGSIVSAFRNGTTPLNLKAVVSGKMSAVELEYRWDNELNLLIPFYRFKGTVTNDRQEVWDVELITPAIETSN